MSLNPAKETTKVMLKAFSDAIATMPTLFLSSFFGKNSSEKSVSSNSTVQIDIERYGENIAVDVLRGGDGNANLVSRYVTKEYLPPLFDEYSSITAQQIQNRMPGRTEYDEDGDKAKMIGLIVKTQIENVKKIWRAIELQAVGCLFSGAVSMTNGDDIDFKRLATHNITPATAWDSTGTPIVDLTLACTVNRKDGKSNSKVAIFGNEAWSAFVSNASVIAYLNNRRIEPGFLTPSLNEQGSVFQGVIWVGSYRLECYTYDQYYTNSSGTATAFIPTEQVVVFEPAARLDKAFGGVEILSYDKSFYDSLGVGAIPLMQAGEMVPYAFVKPPKALVSGVQSAPLLMPTQIDSICNINAT